MKVSMGGEMKVGMKIGGERIYIYDSPREKDA